MWQVNVHYHILKPGPGLGGGESLKAQSLRRLSFSGSRCSKLDLAWPQHVTPLTLVLAVFKPYSTCKVGSVGPIVKVR